MPEDRRLAAIMFTDIVGYTALMGSDEDKAFDMLKRNHSIHESLIQKHNGTLIKEVGDGTLASFPLASDAVRCAIEIQKTCEEQNIPLKIGIHEGEMVFAGADVLGDGVNIASRLQESAEEGCINISGSVYRDIKNKTGIKSEFLEEKTFKNVDEPIKVYNVLFKEKDKDVSKETPTQQAFKKSKISYYIIAGLIVVIAVILIWRFLPFTGSKSTNNIAEVTDKSIAVLPFADISPDKNQEYFSDGMMDAILMHLWKIGDLEVTSRTSVMQYKGTTKTTPQIAEELGVAHVLEGSVSKSGDGIRIIVQLIDASNDKHLWAENYDRKFTDIYEVQSDVAHKIASSLKAVISQEVKDRIETAPTTNMTAYDYYLKGNEAYWRSWDGRVQSTMIESVNYYGKAIELDPNFSLAFTGLGRSYWWLGMEASNTDRPELYEKSKRYLQKAINLDPYNGWAYAELSVVTMDWDWDSTATRKNLDMAIKLMPNDPNAYIHYFWYEQRLGNCDRMIKIRDFYKKFNDLVDRPLSLMNLEILSCQKNYNEITRIAEEYWDGSSFNGMGNIFFSYLLLNEYSKAESVVSSMEVKRFKYFCNGLLRAKVGDRETALVMCDSLKKIDARNSSIAEIYAALGDKEKMYEYLNKAIMEREAMHQFIWEFPKLVDCENDAEFQRIIRELWTPRE